MSDRVSHLLQTLAATCDARDWSVYVDYDEGRWLVQAGPSGDDFSAEGELASSLDAVWQQVVAFCKEQAATGPARRAKEEA